MEKYSKSNTDEFLKLYRQLESLEKDDYFHYDSIKKQYESKFDSFRSIRNNLTHNVTKNNEYPVLVSIDVLNDLREIISYINTKAITKSIRLSKILYVKEGSYLKTVLRLMSERNVSHLPIFDNEFKVKGVISESSMIDLLADLNGIIPSTKRVIDYMNYFKLVDNPNEKYVFMPKDTYFSETKALFLERYKDRRKLGLIFITEHGNMNEKIMGLLSAYSVLG